MSVIDQLRQITCVAFHRRIWRAWSSEDKLSANRLVPATDQWGSNLPQRKDNES
jgi:hypothetical protein